MANVGPVAGRGVRTGSSHLVNNMKIEQASERKPEFRYRSEAPFVYETLSKLPRAGWRDYYGIDGGETVLEHTEALMKLAHQLAPELGLGASSQDELIEMLEIHDWPEALHGDQILNDRTSEEGKVKREQMLQDEEAALKKIVSEMPTETAERIKKLWLRFERGDDEVADLARQLDKLQAILKAAEYGEKTNQQIARDFINNTGHLITHPALKKRLEEIDQ